MSADAGIAGKNQFAEHGQPVARNVGLRSLIGGREYDRLTFRMGRLLAGTPVAGARVLEVDCGEGHMSLWLATHGAHHVTALDPAGPGSRSGSAARFRGSLEHLRLGNVTFLERGLGEHFAAEGWLRYPAVLQCHQSHS